MSKAGGISGNTNTIPFVARKWNDIHQAENFGESAHLLWLHLSIYMVLRCFA